MNQRILFFQLPIESSRMIPNTIEPYSTNRAIIRQEFGQLIIHELIVSLPVFFAFRTTGSFTCSTYWIVLTLPVEVRIIEMEFDTLFLTFFGQLLDNIALKCSGIYDIIIRFLGIEHGETIVMTTSYGDILGTRSLDLGYPFRCIEFRRIESRSQLGILIAMNIPVVHIPFSLGSHNIDTPMEENTELIVLKLLTSLQVFGSRCIGLCPNC